jgi:transcriptional antiterminator NusG
LNIGNGLPEEEKAPSEAPPVEAVNDSAASCGDSAGAVEPEAVAASESSTSDATPADVAAPSATPKEEMGERPSKVEKAEKPDKPEKSDKMEWYILKIQSNREESIREALMRRVAIAGLERYFGDVIVPTEKVTEFKGGKKRVIKRKLYPGYLVVHMEINDDTWFLVRETPGIGDFTGAAGRPSVMLPHEVARIVAKSEEKSEKAPKLKIAFREGDRVKINEGTFENFEGDVESIDETNGRVTVMINIFGRSTPVELEYWQIEAL